jgi:hypothetical protein
MFIFWHRFFSTTKIDAESIFIVKLGTGMLFYGMIGNSEPSGNSGVAGRRKKEDDFLSHPSLDDSETRPPSRAGWLVFVKMLCEVCGGCEKSVCLYVVGLVWRFIIAAHAQRRQRAKTIVIVKVVVSYRI